MYHLYLSIYLNHFAVHQKLTQQCKTIKCQLKKEYISTSFDLKRAKKKKKEKRKKKKKK